MSRNRIGARWRQTHALARFILLVLSMAALGHGAAAADNGLGAFGPEGSRLREQLWLVPSADPNIAMRATLFRPASNPSAVKGVASKEGAERYPLVIINHGTDEATRLSVAMPIYYWLSRWFVERGYAVLLPQRRGHGATGGELAEAIGSCARPDHLRSGLVAAGDIAATLHYMKSLPFVDPDNVIVAGVSTGGWASLALSALEPNAVRAVINFAGGRGGHAYGDRNAVCGQNQLIASTGAYGRSARAPGIWFYSKNDSYFGPELAEAMAKAWTDAGGSVEAHILPAYGSEGHGIADDRAGWDLWGPDLDRFLARLSPARPAIAERHEPEVPEQLVAGAPVPAATPVSAVTGAGEPPQPLH